MLSLARLLVACTTGMMVSGGGTQAQGRHALYDRLVGDGYHLTFYSTAVPRTAISIPTLSPEQQKLGLRVRRPDRAFRISAVLARADGMGRELWSWQLEDFDTGDPTDCPLEVLDAALQSDELIVIYRMYHRTAYPNWSTSAAIVHCSPDRTANIYPVGQSLDDRMEVEAARITGNLAQGSLRAIVTGPLVFSVQQATPPARRTYRAAASDGGLHWWLEPQPPSAPSHAVSIADEGVALWALLLLCTGAMALAMIAVGMKIWNALKRGHPPKH